MLMIAMLLPAWIPVYACLYRTHFDTKTGVELRGTFLGYLCIKNVNKCIKVQTYIFIYLAE
jgi:hypothetical protein